MDLADVHGIADDLLVRAGFDLTDAPGARRIAEALHGPGCIFRLPRSLARAVAWSAVVQGRPRIYLATGLAPEERNHLIGHETAELELRRLGYDGADIEDAADAIGAALVAPRRAFAAVVRDVGADAYGEHVADSGQ